MGSENGDSINGDPLMDINVDIDMDKEPSSSCLASTEKKSTEAHSESNIVDTSTQIKTEQGTSEQCEEPIDDDAKANTNGHHSDELNDTIEDPKVDEDSVESTEKTDNSSTSVETITVEVQPAELAETVNTPEVSEEVNQPILEASHVIPGLDQPKETLAETEQLLGGEVTSETDKSESSAALTVKEEDTIEIIVEAKSEHTSEAVKHTLDRYGDDDEYQPTAAKLVKIDESLTSVESVAVLDSEQEDVAKIADVPSEDKQTNEVKETLSEAVLQVDSESIPTTQLEEEAIVEKKIVASESTDVDKPTIDVEIRSNVDATVAIPAALEPVEPDAIDDTISSDNVISPLASTISNDLDILEEDEAELIEPIIADAETNLLEPSTLAETDIEMLPSIDNAEQMAVEDPTSSVLSSTNSDLAMDATLIIPNTTDEQMDVLENNSMDQDL